MRILAKVAMLPQVSYHCWGFMACRMLYSVRAPSPAFLKTFRCTKCTGGGRTVLIWTGN